MKIILNPFKVIKTWADWRKHKRYQEDRAELVEINCELNSALLRIVELREKKKRIDRKWKRHREDI